MDDVFGFQVSAGGDYCAADKCSADSVAFLLDSRAALAVDGASDASAKLELGIRGVDDGVSCHVGDVALGELGATIADVFLVEEKDPLFQAEPVE